MFWKFFDRLIEPMKTWNREPVLWQTPSIQYLKFGLWTAAGTFFSAFAIFFYLTARGYPLNQRIAPYFFLGGLMIWLCARLVHIASLKKVFFENPKKYLLETKLYNQGGLIAGILIAVIAVYRLGLPFNVALDSMAVGAAAGLIFGRIGCYTYGCCWGRETGNVFGVVYENEKCSVLRTKPHLKGKKLYPTQLMTAFFNLLIFVFLMLLMYYKAADGIIFVTFLLLKQSGRLWLEYYRDDSVIEEKRDYLTVAFAVVIVFAAIALILIDYYKLFKIISEEQSIHRSPMIPSLAQAVRNSNIWKGAGTISILMGLLYGVHGKKIGSW